MKKVLGGIVVLILVASFIGCAHMGPAKSELGPNLVVATPMVKISKKAEVVIMGSGFEPGQEVRIVFTTMDGVSANIGSSLKPKPVANQEGALSTVWSCGRFISRKLIKEGVYTITAADSDYNLIAHAPVAFYADKKPK